MFVYRLASRKYAANNSEGARLYGGRWNHAGTAVIYTSSTRSLAALEIIVHNGAIPADYRVTAIELPDTITVEHAQDDRLPTDWPDETSVSHTASLGTEWAQSLRTAVLRVPSAIFRAESNYILNPWHPDFVFIRFNDQQIEYIDERLRE